MVDDAVNTERQNCISISVKMLLEAEVDEAKIVLLLQKYWDLRLSEVRNYINFVKQDIKWLSEEGTKKVVII